ncbi:daunorubicin resistance protein DrrA family ABC transporter ATP-binding protein [Pseudonocardia spinosispora]|uniref:daunorubicin resistance protein DrrA family ABC transporter ATP-binding protein n=1 Tax=Pseudonocardia spinosispora TaxID=103441 RepID=UPI000404806D|nr:daunorubicin resistance protein DrrA family ABC transporter ATP-binding protein [Pseudonocardia spinosispora]
MSENAALVDVSGLTKSFGDNQVLRGIDLTVRPGEILGVLGPNGAGKTTLINIVATLMRPDGGTVRVAGADVVTDPGTVRRSIGLTGQYAALDEKLTGRENLVLFGSLLGLPKKAARERAAELLETFGLTDAADRQVESYSGGMRRRIDLAVSVVVEPKLLILDEPTTGLDPRSRRMLWQSVSQLRSRGIGVLLTTQYLEEADQLADRIVVIDHGLVVQTGTAAELKARIGETVCSIVPVDPERLDDVARLLSDLNATVEPEHDRVVLPAPDGPRTLAEAMARTERAGVELSDIALRRPSLDEVFLALTEAGARNTREPVS